MMQHNLIYVIPFAILMLFPITIKAQSCTRTWVAEEPVDELNGSGRDATIHVSVTLKEAYIDRFGGANNLELWRSKRDNANTAWPNPSIVSELNDRSDASAYLSSDGLTIWWQRFPSGGGNWVIYTATRTDKDSAWTNLEEVSELTVSGKDQTTPVVSFDELTIWFQSDRDGGLGGADIWVSIRASKTDDWGDPTNVTNLSSADNDSPGWISSNERVFYLSSTRPDGEDHDIFRAQRALKSDPWGTPVAVGDLNTTDGDLKPILSPDRLAIWFYSDRPGGEGDMDIWASVIETCDGDANRDCTVDPLDVGYVTSRFGCSPADFTVNIGCFSADVNGDGIVDPLDSGYVLARFGPC